MSPITHTIPNPKAISQSSDRSSSSQKSNLDSALRNILELTSAKIETRISKLSKQPNTPTQINQLAKLAYVRAFASPEKLTLRKINFFATLEQSAKLMPSTSNINLRLLSDYQNLVQSIDTTNLSGLPKSSKIKPFTVLPLQQDHLRNKTQPLFLHLLNSLDQKTQKILEHKFNLNLKGYCQSSYEDPRKPRKFVVGQGGIGKVRLGLVAPADGDPHRCQLVAVKKMTNTYLAESEKNIATIVKSDYLPEFIGSATFEHPQLIDTQDTNSINDSQTQVNLKHYLVYDLIPGMNGLHFINWLQTIKTSNPDVFKKHMTSAAVQFAKAVRSMHNQGYYHSDIKPENFLRKKGGQFYITDLGYAHNSPQNYKLGTYKYLSPECLVNSRHLPTYSSEKRDSFSLGLCILEMNCGISSFSEPSHVDLNSSTQSDGKTYSFTLRSIPKAESPFYEGLYNSEGLSLPHLEINTLEDAVLRLLDANPITRMSVIELCDWFESLK